jgi:phage shock protein C
MAASDGSKKLYKSRTERMIDGVCGGIAEYFGIDPTLVRVTWVLLTIFGGSGILLYIAGMIIMPTRPVVFSVPEQPAPVASTRGNHRFWGILLVIVGILWLMNNLGVWHRWWDFSWDVLVPTLLILAGIAFLFGGRNYVTASSATPAADNPVQPEQSGDAFAKSLSHKLYRSRLDRKLFGVCGGIGSHLQIDPTIIRIVFVISALASFGLTLLVYAIMAVLVPEEPIMFGAPGASS